MQYKQISLIVRVDVECPDNYDFEDEELAGDLELLGFAFPEGHECEVIDFEISGLNMF